MIVAGSTNPLLLASAAGGYNLTNSLRFRSSATASLTRTFSTPTNQKIWTYSFWFKRGTLSVDQGAFIGNNDGTNQWYFRLASNNTLYIGDYNNDVITTTPVYRDPSAWYHIVLAYDTTQATATNRIKLYVNGVQQSYSQGGSFPSQNSNPPLNQASLPVFIGNGSGFTGMDGYMAEVNFIDGQALTPSSFGETSTTTGVWQPKKYAGTYGTNGFYLPFTDNSALTTSSNVGLGKDFSGNGNYWTTNNISITSGSTYDSMTDVPTLTSATASNFNVLNPLSVTTGTVSAGNLQYVGASASKRINGTLAVNSGKWYWEVTLLNAPESPRSSTSAYNGFGFGLATAFDSTAGGTSSTDWINLKDNGYYKNFSNANTDTGVTFSSGDVLAIAVDLDANTFTFYRNNSSLATGTLGVTAGTQLVPAMYSYNGSFGAMACNFGQRPFAYTPPTGFVALNTFNLPTPTIGATASTQAGKYFNTVLWTGTDSSANRSITGVGFQPDLVWTKTRSSANQHILYDAVRGAGSTKDLSSNTTDAEGGGNEDLYGYLASFDSDGFTGNVGSLFNLYFNSPSDTYVAWNWKANGTGVTNTDGSITSTVSANTSSGFSVVTFTDAGSACTVGHGLGVAPDMIIVKFRGASGNWSIYHKSLGATKRLIFTTSAELTSSGYWNNTAPTSSVFSLGSDLVASTTQVAYCFSEVAGYSKFGSWTGNGSADGPFIYTGFKPRFVLIKRTDSSTAASWFMFDTARSTINPVPITGGYLLANSSDAEGGTGDSGAYIDLVSNGFKIRNSSLFDNASGGTFIYACFAENPFKYSLAR